MLLANDMLCPGVCFLSALVTVKVFQNKKAFR